MIFRGRGPFLSFVPMVILLFTAEAKGAGAFTMRGEKVGSRVRFLSLFAEGGGVTRGEGMGQARLPLPYTPSFTRVERILKGGEIPVSIRFSEDPSDETLERLEEAGVRFNQRDGKRCRAGRVFGAFIPEAMVDGLDDFDEIERVEAQFHPVLIPPLDVSIPEIGADGVWKLPDEKWEYITGEGVIIADFDTGIDIFHPAFFKTGEPLKWFDADEDGVLQPGTDGVDTNGDGSIEEGEILHLIDTEIHEIFGTIGGGEGFEPSIDYLFLDYDGDGERDYGRREDYDDGDPSFGEQIYVAADMNRDGITGGDEPLYPLTESKIIAFLEEEDEWTRGDDLITAPGDPGGHGTGACAVAAGGMTGPGGATGFYRYTGVAPGAEIVMVNIYTAYSDFTYYIPWAYERGARVMLYEFAPWIFEFLDGSSNLEMVLDEYSSLGAVQVVPSGNLAGSSKHSYLNLSGGEEGRVGFEIPEMDLSIYYVYVSILWRMGDRDFHVTLEGPDGSTTTIFPSFVDREMDGLWYASDFSDRGTGKVDIFIYKEEEGSYIPLDTGGYELFLENRGGESKEVNLYIADDVSGWGAGAKFLDHVDDLRTLTSPSTADSAVTVGSYSSRGYFEREGDLSPFSGRGPRIDGVQGIDIAAPGHYDLIAPASSDMYGTFAPYGWYGGTSGAGPHVAGAAALLLSYDTDLTPEEVSELLYAHASADEFTGETPNLEWGWGKLNIYDSVSVIYTPPEGGCGCSEGGQGTLPSGLLIIILIPPFILIPLLNSLHQRGTQPLRVIGSHPDLLPVSHDNFHRIETGYIVEPVVSTVPYAPAVKG